MESKDIMNVQVNLLHLGWIVMQSEASDGWLDKKLICQTVDPTGNFINKIDEAISFIHALKWIEIRGLKLRLTSRGNAVASCEHWRFIVPNSKELKIFENANIDNWLISPEVALKRPKVLDLFAGVGGLALGFEGAGFEVVASIDNDTHACDAHRKNFPNSVVINADINELAKDPASVLNKHGVKTSIDGVVGGPPCQGFSYMGERVVDDDRSFLTTRFTEIVNKLEPKFFMMENVAGLKTIGSRPKISKYFIDLGKGIGSPASALVKVLPDISSDVAKRGPQFKKRTISSSVSLLRNEIFAALGEDINSANLSAILRSPEKRFVSAFVIACKDNSEILAADKNWMQLAQVAIKDQYLSIFKITLGLVVEAKIIHDSSVNVEEFVNEIAELLTNAHGGKAIQQLMVDYYAQPNSVKFNGEHIGPILARIIERVSKKYNVYGPKVLNAYHYGAPQSRSRLFLIGIRKDLDKKFEFPVQQYELRAKDNLGLFKPAITCEEALSDLPDVDKYTSLLQGDSIGTNELYKTEVKYAEYMRLESCEPNNLTLPRPTWNPFVLDCSNRTVHSQDVVTRLENTKEGIQDKTSGKTRLHRDGVSHTLRAGTKEEKGSHTAVRPVHYEYNRVVTVREGARLMGFPDWMTFHHTKWHGFRLVGNAVPFQLARAVANSIKETLIE